MSNGSEFNYEPKFDMEVYFESPCSDKDIRELEKDLNARFSDDYVAFLKQWNGLKFHSEIEFPVMVRPMEPYAGLPETDWDDEEDYVSITDLFGVNPDDENDLRKWQSSYGFNRHVPEDFIAIGGYPGPFMIAMHRSRGTVYAWSDVDCGNPNRKEMQPTMDLMRKVGNSFHHFWSRLELAPDI